GLNKNMPTVLYRGMIHPIRPFTIAGALWYQGESNRAQPDLYRRTFPALIRDWRQQWDRDFPFYFVQIAPYAYGGDRGQAARQREAQAAALALPKTGMAVTLDVGNPRDIHPNDKQSVADRLGRLALRDHYGHDVVAEGPTFDRAEFRAARVVLHFEHAEDLNLIEREQNEFEVAGEDRVFYPARAVVRNSAVVVSSDSVPKPKAVRYAWRAAPQATLFGREDLPAPPFRTDDWSNATRAKPDVRRHRTRETGFRSLFDGKSLDGWVNVNGALSTWQVKDADTIACSGIPTGVLRTERQYENFILELEYRHLRTGGNAGVFVWSDPLTARGQPFTRSVEVQVLDGREGDWFTSDGDIFPIHGSTMTPENGRGGSRAFPTEKRAHPSPEWNHYRIECMNGRISLAVNGKVVTRGRDCRPRKGYVCLESEGSPVEFRHVRLKELPSTATLSASDTASRARGFENLYNGVDLAGWNVTPAHRESWKAKDWILDFDGQGPDLWTQESFGDFTLVCDWRWSGEPTDRALPVILADGMRAVTPNGTAQTEVVPDAGDSGIYLRGNTKSQVNIWCWPVGSGEVYGYRTEAKFSDEVRAAVTPSERADAPIGKWNRFEITLVGERLTVVLNGKTVIDRATLPGVPAEGPIGLQRHGSPIQFANIFIRRLTPRTDRF
ncbi:MAG: family 16 glycoside hydrolase, partial [Planctomycetota bacterium]